jgi:hypothetical protein
MFVLKINYITFKKVNFLLQRDFSSMGASLYCGLLILCMGGFLQVKQFSSPVKWKRICSRRIECSVST